MRFRNAFSFWLREPATPREAPALVARVAVFGAVTGVGLSAIAEFASGRPSWPADLPIWLLYSAGLGAIFSTSFYITCGLPWMFLRPILRGYPTSIKYVITVTAGALGACAGFLLASWLSGFFPGVHIYGREHIGTVLMVEAAAGATLALVIGAFKKLREEVRVAEAKVHEKEVRAAKAQASALQAQINPHFFFNTLNTLSALIAIDSAAAQEIVGRLADMFRYTMACSRADLVTLEQELRFVENYLKLEQARFSGRLGVDIPPGNFEDILLPGLTLQPLVENAVRHGIAKRIEGGTVGIAIERNGGRCIVTVSNPCEAADEPVFREGHALSNVRERLQLFAEGRASLNVEKPGAESIRAILTLPLDAARKERN